MSEPEPGAAEAVGVAVRATATPTTVDREARTVDVVWSTGARAQNYVPSLGVITEELDLSPSAVRMGMLTSGNAPVLDTHRSDGVRSVIGRVVSAGIEGGRGVAKLQFSGAEDVRPVFDRIADGTVRNVSVGYRIFKYQQVKDGSTTVHRAVDWEPFEISIVPVPVDRGAVVRGETDAGHPPVTAAVEPPPTTAAPAAPLEQTMTENVTTAAPETVAAPVDAAAVAAEAVRAERERLTGVEGILTAARGLIAPETESALREKALKEKDPLTVEAARAAVFDAMIAKQRTTTTTPVQTVKVGISGDDPVAIRAAMADAMAAEISVSYRASLPKDGRHLDYMGWRPSDMVRALMEARGERNLPRNPVQFAERAFHTTSDFPLLLEAAANKSLLADYALATPTFQQFMGRRTFNDFKAHKFLRVGDFPTLAALNEGGEITMGTISEGRESITIATYAKGISVTRQMLVNDDLGAFSDFAGMIGRRVMDFQNTTAFTVVTTASGAGPNMADGNAVFTTTRDNKASSGAAIDVTTLSTARQKLRSKTSPDGLKLNLAPRYLLTGPAYETIAWQYSSANYVPATAGNTNPFAGVYTPIVDANITGNNWYLFADPAVAPVYIYGYLRGAEGPQTRSYELQGSDGAIRVDVWLDFACGAIDWRGAWMNPGA